MKLFGFKKKKEEKPSDEEVIIGEGENSIKVLGVGCEKCTKLFKNVVTACQNIEYSCEIKKVSDVNEIASYGVMSVPALVINDELKTQGKVLTEGDIANFLNDL